MNRGERGSNRLKSPVAPPSLKGFPPLAGEVALEPGDYESLQLAVSDVAATLDGGGDATVEVPGDAPLTFEAAFEIRAGERTTFTADVTPVRAGGSGKYVLQPVAEETTVSYEDETTATTTG